MRRQEDELYLAKTHTGICDQTRRNLDRGCFKGLTSSEVHSHELLSGCYIVWQPQSVSKFGFSYFSTSSSSRPDVLRPKQSCEQAFRPFLKGAGALLLVQNPCPPDLLDPTPPSLWSLTLIRGESSFAWPLLVAQSSWKEFVTCACKCCGTRVCSNCCEEPTCSQASCPGG